MFSSTAVLRNGFRVRAGVCQCPWPSLAGAGSGLTVCAVEPAVGVCDERRGADHAVVLEVQEQPVVAGAGDGGGEGDARPGRGDTVAGGAGGVHVQVGQVAVTERDEVPVGGQVRLQIGDRGAVPAHRQGQLRGLPGDQVTGQRDGVTVDLRGPGRSRGRNGCEGTGDGEIGAQGDPVVPDRGEIGEHPVLAGLGQVQRHGPGAVRGPGRVHVLEPGQVPANHDEMQFLVVRDLVGSDRPAVGPENPKVDRDLRPGGQRTFTELQRVAVLGRHQPSG